MRWCTKIFIHTFNKNCSIKFFDNPLWFISRIRENSKIFIFDANFFSMTKFWLQAIQKNYSSISFVFNPFQPPFFFFFKTSFAKRFRCPSKNKSSELLPDKLLSNGSAPSIFYQWRNLGVFQTSHFQALCHCVEFHSCVSRYSHLW